MSFQVTDASGKTVVNDPRDNGHWNYSEAWWIPPGSGGQGINTSHYADTYSLPTGPKDTCGTITFTGSVQLYVNIALPGAFVTPNPNTHAGRLPSTTTPNAMAGFGPMSVPSPVAHNVTVTWRPPGGKTKVS